MYTRYSVMACAAQEIANPCRMQIALSPLA